MWRGQKFLVLCLADARKMRGLFGDGAMIAAQPLLKILLLQPPSMTCSSFQSLHLIIQMIIFLASDAFAPDYFALCFYCDKLFPMFR